MREVLTALEIAQIRRVHELYDLSEQQLRDLVGDSTIKYNVGQWVIMKMGDVKRVGKVTEIPENGTTYIDQMLIPNDNYMMTWKNDSGDCECIRHDESGSVYFIPDNERHYFVKIYNPETKSTDLALVSGTIFKPIKDVTKQFRNYSKSIKKKAISPLKKNLNDDVFNHIVGFSGGRKTKSKKNAKNTTKKRRNKRV